MRSCKLMIMISTWVGTLLLSVLTSGCSSEAVAPTAKSTLKIAIETLNYYEYKYGDYIKAAYPNLDVELIPLISDANHYPTSLEMKEKLEQEKPDLIISGVGRFKDLANEGVFLDITDKLSRSGMKEDDFYPGMMEWLKQDGEGRLYGLSPYFNSDYLLYNEDLFNKAGVELPHDDMTLEEIYQLASRFIPVAGSDNGIVGYHQQFSNLPYNYLEEFARNDGMQMVDLNAGVITMNTPAWHHIMEVSINLYQFGTLSIKEIKPKLVNGVQTYDQEATQQADLFKQGKAAMAISYNLGSLVNYNFKFGAVLPPVSPTERNRSASIQIFDVMSIGSNAANPEMAWKVIEMMTSDHVAKVTAKLGVVAGYSTRKSYVNYNQNPLVSKVFDLLPFQTSGYSDATYGSYNDSFRNQSFPDLVNREVIAAVKGEKSVDQAIALIQKDGQALLDAAKIK